MPEQSLTLTAPLGDFQTEFKTAFAWPLLSLLTCSHHARPQAPQSDELPEILLQHVSTLSITAYEDLISQLLRAIGYEEVRVLRDPQRKRHSHKGRNSHGGVDIIAQSRSGLAADAVLVQVKQYQRPVSRRFVDELRGALLRTESRHALLITTSRFSPAACKAAQEDHIAPVHLMDRTRLCDLLIQHQIGVWLDRHNQLQIDSGFFRRLTKKHPNLSVRKSAVTLLQTDATSGKGRAETNRPSQSLTGDLVEKGGEMMGRTHALFGITTLWLLKPLGLITADNLAPLVVIAVLGALSPDLDASESQLKRFNVAGITPFAPLAQVLHQSFGHRGLLHSLAGLGIFSMLCALPIALWLGWLFGVALALGYASHLLADAATKSGIPLLYPRRKRYHLLPKGWRVTTGSLAEETLLPLLALAVLLLLMGQLANIS